MKWQKNNSLITALFISLALGLTGPAFAMAATSPSLGTATSFGILGSTYTNTAAGTLNGDLGYTTPPSVPPTVNGTTHVADGTYNQAGTDQGSALSILNAQTCNFTFGSDTDLSLLPQPLAPGVYCVAGAQSIGTGGITLSGTGTYIFRSTGALNTVANSNISLNGATACDVFWTPGGATTLGANSSFVGTDIDDSGITVGSTVTWNGRALAFATTVTTNADIISIPVCTTPVFSTPTPTPTPTPATTPTTTVVAPVSSPTITPTPTPTPAPVLAVASPKLPNTGLAPEDNNNSTGNIIIPTGIFIALVSFFLINKKAITKSK